MNYPRRNQYHTYRQFQRALQKWRMWNKNRIEQLTTVYPTV